MNQVVLDYANWRPPSAQTLVNHGVVGVVRYIYPARYGWPKALTPRELTDLHSVGLDVAFNLERNPDDWRRLSGAETGQQAAQAMSELGMGDPVIPVYVSIDEYVHAADYPAVARYVQAFHDACKHRPGVYGQGDLIEYLHGRGLCDFGWQSNSTSFPGNGQPTAHTCLRQHYAWVQSGLAGDYDVNTIIRSDWGQYPRPKPPTPEVKMHPRFNPPLQGVVDSYAHGADLLLLQRDGGVFTDTGSFYGSSVGDPKFHGPAARLVGPNEVVVDGNNRSEPSFDEAAAGYHVIVIVESATGKGAGRFGLPKGGKH